MNMHRLAPWRYPAGPVSLRTVSQYSISIITRWVLAHPSLLLCSYLTHSCMPATKNTLYEIWYWAPVCASCLLFTLFLDNQFSIHWIISIQVVLTYSGETWQHIYYTAPQIFYFLGYSFSSYQRDGHDTEILRPRSSIISYPIYS